MTVDNEVGFPLGTSGGTGSLVGWALRSSDGGAVGAPIECILGREVGEEIYPGDGSSLGRTLGSTVGNDNDFALGTKVGCDTGAPVAPHKG